MKNETIICLAAAGWDGMWARAQQLMSIFAGQGNRVLYVDPPITWLSPLKNPSLRQGKYDSLRRVEENIWVYSPPVTVPFGNIYRMVNRFNQRRLSSSLKKVCRTLGWQPTIYWTYLPNTVDLPVPEGPLLLYDCADEHTAFPGLIKKETVAGMERELFAKAGVALTSAGELWQKKKAQAPGLFLAPNGADVLQFSTGIEAGVDGSAGTGLLAPSGAWLCGGGKQLADQRLLADAAGARPHWSWC